MLAPGSDVARGAVSSLETLPPRPTETRPSFTGQGGEYFRIWVVNTLLTLLTLGIYSAWAKVRRTRYLWQNTRLDGFAFDYHARPVAILRGRILALVLFGAYTYSFDFSRTAGLLSVLLVCAVGPWLFMRSQQFKLGNTSWRGLRFAFDGRSPEAFRIVLPILLLWFSGTVAAVWYPTDFRVLFGAQVPAIVATPWMHHRLKAYQHGRARYGDQAFAFDPVLLRFYATYAKGFFLLAAGTFLGGFGSFFILERASDLIGVSASVRFASQVYAVLAVILIGITIFVFTWPYLAARIQESVWSSTRVGGVRFFTVIRAGELFRLTLRNVAFTFATLGLYWPYASMSFARYRIECMRVDSGSSLTTIAAGTHAGPGGAVGEGALDAFGLDVGL